MVRAVAAAVTLALLAGSSATGAKGSAMLRLESISPLIVSGSAFGANERVVLAYAGAHGPRRTVRTAATRQGRFRAFFRLRLERCDSFTVRANGEAGSRAILQVVRHCPHGERKRPRKPPRDASD
jgi:hypothetical protein